VPNWPDQGQSNFYFTDKLLHHRPQAEVLNKQQIAAMRSVFDTVGCEATETDQIRKPNFLQNL